MNEDDGKRRWNGGEFIGGFGCVRIIHSH